MPFCDLSCSHCPQLTLIPICLTYKTFRVSAWQWIAKNKKWVFSSHYSLNIVKMIVFTPSCGTFLFSTIGLLNFRVARCEPPDDDVTHFSFWVDSITDSSLCFSIKGNELSSLVVNTILTLRCLEFLYKRHCGSFQFTAFVGTWIYSDPKT